MSAKARWRNDIDSGNWTNATKGVGYSYDALGRPVKILLAEGASYTSYIYQGNFTAVVDPAGKWKLFAKDALGNLVTVLEPDPLATPLVTSPPSPPPAYPVTAAPAGMLLTTYTYDQFNHLTQVAMPRSTANGMKTQTRTFAYTATAHPNINLPALWLTSATNPESGTVSYTYNSDGTLASKTDANGNTETYTYDVYQRLTSIPDRQQTFTYDTCPGGARGCVSMAGQLMQTVFGTSLGPNGLTLEYNYSYTPAGKVSGKTLQLIGGVGYETAIGTVAASYTFDGQGALTQTSYTPAFFVNTFNYTLDAMERPTGMTDNLSHTWVTGATYNAANQMTSNGIQTWTYNSLYQITGVTGTGMNMTYNYSATQNNGQIASSVDSVKSETIDYQYDLLKRLSSATATSGAWGESYVYDGYGNLTQMNPTAGAPPSMNLTVQADANGVPTNQITGTYDNNGNLKWLGNNTSLSYDAANRLNMVLANGQFSYYGYDADNRRVWYQNASGVQAIYFYGADGRKVTSYTFTMSAPNIVMTPAQNYGNIYFAGVPLETEGNAVSTDRLGSVRNGGGAGYQAEYPYGVEYSLTSNDREKYATYTRDSLTGLDYAVNRYYWGQWGRFISPDPYGGSAKLGNPQSWNRYGYARNNPVNSNDASGLDAFGYTGSGDGSSGVGGIWGGGAAFGSDTGSSSPCQQLVQFSFSQGSDFDFAGFPGALAACEAAYAAGPYGNGSGTISAEDAAIALAESQISDNSSCADLFETGDNFVFTHVFGGDPAAYLQGLQQNGDIVVSSTFPSNPGPGTFTGPGVGAATTPYGGPTFTFLGTPVSTPLITINPSGFFFTGTVNGTPVQNIANSGFQGLTSLAQVQAAVLLHELAHATGVFGPDKGQGIPANQSQVNTATIVSKCFP